MKKNVIEIGKRYFIGTKRVETLAYIPKNEVLMVRETDGNLFFILGDFYVNENELIYNSGMSFTVTEEEILHCINTYMVNNNIDKVNKDNIIVAIRSTYYRIPTKIAEVFAEWYLR